MTIGPDTGIYSRKVGPLKFCIYCGAKEYVPGSLEPLSDEHAVPEGLAGAIIIEEASCRKCQKTINEEVEQQVLRGQLLPMRQHLKLKSKKKNRPNTSPSYKRRDGALISLDDVGGDVLLPAYGTDAFLNENPPLVPCHLVRSAVMPKVTSEKLEAVKRLLADPTAMERLRRNAEADPKAMMQVNISLFAFNRFLAKIAHCMCVVHYGYDNFAPLLQKFILGKRTKSSSSMSEAVSQNRRQYQAVRDYFM